MGLSKEITLSLSYSLFSAAELQDGKAASETWLNPRVKLNFSIAWSFQQELSCEMDVMLNVNFALFSNNKNELRDLYNYLSQPVISAINT